MTAGARRDGVNALLVAVTLVSSGGLACTGIVSQGGLGSDGGGGRSDAPVRDGAAGQDAGFDRTADRPTVDGANDPRDAARPEVPNSCPLPAGAALPLDDASDQRVRVFIAAGQSNMVGSDAPAAQIDDFPPYVGAGAPQPAVRFSYLLERDQASSNGWVPLAPALGAVGPEVTFARKVTRFVKAPIAIIKSAVGGTTLWQDWAPSAPAAGLQLYPRTLALVRASLKALDDQNIPYRLEGVLWHQGENDMLDGTHVGDYEANLRAFVASLRADLGKADLPIYIGEISAKGVWGYDFRQNMKALRDQQLRVVAADPKLHWVPTSHVGFNITGGGPHYHFGTLGQLEHGEGYADAYLRTLGGTPSPPALPYCPGPDVPAGKKVQLFVLMGHRSVDGEAAWVDSLSALPAYAALARPNPATLYQYFVGGGVHQSSDWTPLGPAQFLGRFGPELTLGAALDAALPDPVALIKLSDGAAAMPDWYAQPTRDTLRPVYANAMAFLKRALDQLTSRGIAYEVKGVFWAHGELDSWAAGYLPDHAAGLKAFMASVRGELRAPAVPWVIAGASTKLPWSAAVTTFNDKLQAVVAQDGNARYVDTLDLPFGPASFGTEGSLKLGERLAATYLQAP